MGGALPKLCLTWAGRILLSSSQGGPRHSSKQHCVPADSPGIAGTGLGWKYPAPLQLSGARLYLLFSAEYALD